MKAKIRWAPSALADLRAIRAWLRARNASEAARFTEAIKGAMRLLAEFPHLGAVALDLEPMGRYRNVVRGWHRIVYRVDDGIVYILRVWDCRRDPAELGPVE